MDYQKLLDEIKSVALEEGKVLRQSFMNPEKIQGEFTKTEKWEDDLDITTKLDSSIERVFYERLSTSFPELGFFLEEHPELNNEDKNFVCYIDPIDGTKHFAKGIPLFNMSVGIVRDGEPVAGVTYNPIAKQLYAGAEGIPTTLNGKPVSVSTTQRLEDAFVALDVASHKENWEAEKDWMNKKIVEFNLKAKRIRLFSVGACVTSWVANGALDAFVSIWGHGSKPFDIAAGKALIKYSKGGKIVDLEVPGLSTPRFVGGNKYLVEEITKVLLE
ncbi:hypothetical protein GF362_06835 [Candidatus Dojkabacteria bacterium]|nr:hypothetical protein [Candidatus Dojkabacteria bacterium]